MGGTYRWAVTLLVALSLLAAATDVAQATLVETVAEPLGSERLVPGPDGGLWGLEMAGNADDRPQGWVVRVDAGGVRTRTGLPEDLSLVWGSHELHVLSDGTTGLFARRIDAAAAPGSATGTLVLVRFAPRSGAVRSVIDLPREAWDASGLTVAPDGATWFARSCEDELDRVAPDGHVSRVRLPRIGCGMVADRELGAALAFDAKGALWLVNLCMGRIDRVSLTGDVHEWRAPRIACDDFYGVKRTIAVDPLGGITYASRGSYEGGSGRVRDGRRERFPSYGAGTFTSDGTLWRSVPSGIERRDLGGSIKTFHMPRGISQVSDLALTRDEGVAIVRGSYWKSYDGDPHNSSTPVYLAPRLVALAADGTETSWALPDGGTDASSQLGEAETTLGPDGGQWILERRYRGISFHSIPVPSRLLHVLPDDLAPPRMPAARVQAVLGRVARTLWLQLVCEADPARFCLGSAAFAGAGIAVAPARFAIAGQTRTAVPVRLGERAARMLRRRGVLRATAIVRVDDGAETRRSLRLTR